MNESRSLLQRGRDQRLPVNRLESVFRAAVYRVQLRGALIQVRLGHRHPVLDAKVGRNHCWVILTAFNPHGRRARPGLNRARQNHLETRIRRGHHKFARAVGGSRDRRWQEPSLCIADIERDLALELARHWKQAAVILGGPERTAELLLLDPGPQPVGEPGTRFEQRLGE